MAPLARSGMDEYEYQARAKLLESKSYAKECSEVNQGRFRLFIDSAIAELEAAATRRAERREEATNNAAREESMLRWDELAARHELEMRQAERREEAKG